MSDETQETTCLDFGDECQVASDFYDAGYDAGTKGVTAILTDLITELRETAAVKPGATGRLLMEMVGSAEARLREVRLRLDHDRHRHGSRP